MPQFRLKSSFSPCGDQPRAIKELTQYLSKGQRYNTLIGVTGSGKTFTVANLIQTIQRPTLVIAHNKTLAAQLFQEFKEFFPDNAVEYFVSYYDYYQPEAYIPSSDTYIEKDSSINDEIDRLRQRATMSLLTRRDVIVVASVSCIYGLGSPEIYFGMVVNFKKGTTGNRDEYIEQLIKILYERNPIDFSRGKIRVSGDILDIFPSYDDKAIRIEFYGDEIDRIQLIDPLTSTPLDELNQITVFPAKHWVTPPLQLKTAITRIKQELEEQVHWFEDNNQLVEAQRINQRTKFDIEMMQEIGYCTGIENYSRHLSERAPGSSPETLIDYLPDDALIVIDESHATVPQIHGMYAGDHSRKKNLIDFGFRLPSAFDNRPLRFPEFEEKVNQLLFISATPGDWELGKSQPAVIEQIIRPTGLLDPEIILRPATGQVDDLIHEIQEVTAKKERVLVTTLTKKMAENLSEHLNLLGIKTRYLHSVIDTMERIDIIRSLRKGEFDVLVGVNLLREGLDLPEVSTVAILDADKEGFLRSEKSLIQTMGRCARNVNSRALLYADKITGSMQRAIEVTNRRRKIQEEYNQVNGIEPKSIIRTIQDSFDGLIPVSSLEGVDRSTIIKKDEDIEILIKQLGQKMRQASQALDFENAAKLRDEIIDLKRLLMGIKSP